MQSIKYSLIFSFSFSSHLHYVKNCAAHDISTYRQDRFLKFIKRNLLRLEDMFIQNDEEPIYTICLFTYTYFSSTPKYINK